jgi:ATP-dependent Clp protease protease subunit
MYVVDSSADEPIMLIDKHIGYDELDGMGVDGALFQQELLQLDGLGKKRIRVWINSPGGTVVNGYSIYNAILKSKTPVDTYCYGIAASIAGVIFQAGRKRIMADYGILMYHNPFGGESSDGIEAMRQSICTMITKRSGMSSDDCEKMMNRDTFILADEAVRTGMADEIEESMDYNKKRLTPASVNNSTKSYWRESKMRLNRILNKKDNQNPDLKFIDEMIPHHEMALEMVDEFYSKVKDPELKKLMAHIKSSQTDEISVMKGFRESIINNKTSNKYNTKNMQKVTNKLSLNPEASEDAAVIAIDAILNRASKAEDLLVVTNKKSTEDMDKMKNDLDEAEDKFKKMKDAYDALKKEKDEADEAAKTKDAKNMVAGFVKTGAIKNEAGIIAKWEATAKADLEGTKNLLESIPINKKASKIEVEAEGEAPKRSFQGAMIEINNRTQIKG